MNRELYTLSEAKRLLSIKRTATILRYQKQGLIKIIRLNPRRWYVERAEVEGFINRLNEIEIQKQRKSEHIRSVLFAGKGKVEPEWKGKLREFGVI